MRVVIAEDMALLREGLARLLADAGFDVTGAAADLPGLLDLVGRTAPDAALIDIKMPPTHTDEGLQAANVIRQRYPGTAVLLLSSYLESRYASIAARETTRQAPDTCSRSGSMTRPSWPTRCGESAQASASSIRASSAVSSAAAGSEGPSTNSPSER